MRIIILKGPVDAALNELGCMRAVPCRGRPHLHECTNCREAAQRAVRAALIEIFPKAEIEIKV